MFLLKIHSYRKVQQRKYCEAIISISPKIKELRKAANRFLLKVHPDFFRDTPKIAKVNEDSLAQLNGFIDIVEQNSKLRFFRLIKSKTADKFVVKFYLRSEKGYETIKCDYRFPPHFFTCDVPVQEIETEAVLYVNQLLDQAGLDTVSLGSGTVKVKKEDGQDVQDTPNDPNDINYRRDLLEKIIKDEDAYRKSMLRQMDPEFNVTLWKFRQMDDRVKTGDVLLEQDSIYMEYDRQIFYAPSLTSAQRSQCYRDFNTCKEELDHHLWADLPILFTNGSYLAPHKLAGFITIPYDFNVRELVDYIHGALPTIREQRRVIRTQIHTLRFLQQQISLAFQLKSLKFHGLRQRVIDCLNSLIISEEVERFHLRGFNLVISHNCEEPRIDWKTETITLPDFCDGYKFLELLVNNEEELEERRETENLLEDHRLKLLEFAMSLKILIGCKEILIGHNIADKQFTQFVGMVNLKRHYPFLKAQKLHDITFVISDQFKFDRKNKTLDFPYDFSEDRYFSFLEKVKAHSREQMQSISPKHKDLKNNFDNNNKKNNNVKNEEKIIQNQKSAEACNIE